MTLSRTPAGVPTGGQFAVSAHTEADFELGVPEPIPEPASPLVYDQNLYAAAGSYAGRQRGEMSVAEKHKAMGGFTDTHGFAEWHCTHANPRGLSMSESYAVFATADKQRADPLPLATRDQDAGQQAVTDACLRADLTEDPVELAKMASHEHPWVRETVVANAHTAQSTLRRLATDNAPIVRRAVSGRLEDEDLLRVMAGDRDLVTASRAKSRLGRLKRRDKRIRVDADRAFEAAQRDFTNTSYEGDWTDERARMHYLYLLKNAYLRTDQPRRLDCTVKGTEWDLRVHGSAAGDLLDTTASHMKLPESVQIVDVAPGHYALIW